MKTPITTTFCYHCQCPVILTDSAYTCENCGFAATMQTVDFARVWYGEVDVRLGAIKWVGGKAHSVEVGEV